MPPPWYRSRLFWLGLAGLVMLLLAWGIRRRTTVILSADNGDFAVGVSRTSSVIGFRLDRPGSSPVFTWEVERVQRHRNWVPPEVFAPAIRISTIRGHSVSIGIWFIVLLYTAVWYGAMVYWLRRKYRIMMNPLGRENLPELQAPP